MNKKLLIILLFLNLFIVKTFSNPQMDEAVNIIKEFDEKLKKFEGEYNKVSNYYFESLDEYKDLLIESNEYEDVTMSCDFSSKILIILV